MAQPWPVFEEARLHYKVNAQEEEDEDLKEVGNEFGYSIGRSFHA